MPDQDQQDEGDPQDEVRAVPKDHLAHVVERHAEHRACKPERVQTQVAEHVAEQAGHHLVGVPHAQAHVGEFVALGVVEREDADGRDHAEHDHNPFGDGGAHHAGQGDAAHDDAAHDEQGPSERAERSRETVDAYRVDGLDDHGEAEMHHADDQRQDHAARVPGDLVRQEDPADARETFPLGDVDREEGVQEEAHDHGRDTEGGHERGEAAEAVHLLEQQAHEDEHQAVAGVTHAEGEEQQEEDRDERGRVETVIGRAAVHVGEDLEHLDELVVLELDRRVFLNLCFFFEIEDALALQVLGHGGIVLRRGEADEGVDGVLRCGDRGGAGEVAVEFRLEAEDVVPHLRDALLALLEDLAVRRDLLLLLVEEGLEVGGRVRGGGEGLEREAGVVAYDDEPDGAVLLVHDLQGVLLLPGGIELLGGDAVVVEAECGKPLAVIFAPGADVLDLPEGGVALREQGGEGVVHTLLGAFDVAADCLDVVEQVLGVAVHGLGGTRDVHDAELLQSGEEVLLVSVQEDEGVLGHLGDHRLASSSSA